VSNFVDISGTNYLDQGGAGPAAGLILANSTLYGTTTLGGGYDGNVYALNLGVPLTFQSGGGQLVLTWSNSAFSLQSSPSLPGTFTNIANATSPYTNIPTATQQFFRLQAN
jgi:hypothetical protein